MAADLRKTDFSPGRRRFIEFLQRVNFGFIESLRLAEGEPVLDPPPPTTIEVKFGGDNSPRPEHALEDFALKAPVLQLFEYFDRIRNGVIPSLQVRDGLPFKMTLTAA